MRTEHTQFDIFKYEELSDAAQAKVFEKMSTWLTDDKFSFLSEMLNEDLQEQYGISGKVEYSLSYCQGDGLCVNTTDLLSNIIMTKIKSKLTAEQKTSFEYLLKNYCFTCQTKNNWRYSFCSKSQIITDFDSGNMKTKQLAKWNKFVYELENIIYSIYKNICSDFEKIGYGCYDITEQDIIEYIDANNYEFLADGTQY